MYGALDIAVSGMVAQRIRGEVITANIVNKDAILDSRGQLNPFRRRIAMFSPGDPTGKTPEARRLGVHVTDIALDQTPFPKTYNPSSPYADKDGYVLGSNINPVVEQTDFLEASRAYEACAVAAETTKSMMAQGLRLIA